MLINSPNISGSLTVTGNATISGSLNVAGGISAAITGSATSASYVEYSNVANKPTLVSGSAQVAAFGFATTGSNQFNGSQAITGSLTVTGQVIAQTLNVQQVTSSIVYSSGSNIFGSSLSNTQQLTGSVSVTGSLTVNGTNSVFNAGSGTLSSDILTVRGGGGTGNFGFKIEANNGEDIFYTNNFTYDIVANPVSGRFGIGTTTPTNGKLEVQQTATTAALWVQTGGTTSASTIADFRTGTNLPALQILGNGTATFGSSVTAASYVSNATSGILFDNTSGGTNATQIRLQNTGGNMRVGIESSTGGTIQVGTSAYAAVFGNQANAATQFTTNGTLRMTITSDGLVRIGPVTDSDGTLQVRGLSQNTYNSNGYNGTGANIRLLPSSTGGTNITTGISMGVGGAAEAYIGAVQQSNTLADIVFQTFNGSAYGERMRITSGGNVLINTTSDIGERLTLNGRIGIVGATVASGNTRSFFVRGAQNVADDGTLNLTIANTSLVFIAENNTGTGALFFLGFASSTINKISDPSNMFDVADTDGKLCIFKSGVSDVATVKNRLGDTRSITVSYIGVSD